MDNKEIEELKIKETELKKQLSEIDNLLYYNIKILSRIYKFNNIFIL